MLGLLYFIKAVFLPSERKKSCKKVRRDIYQCLKSDASPLLATTTCAETREEHLNESLPRLARKISNNYSQ